MPKVRNESNVAVGGASVQIAPGNLYRSALIIGTPKTAVVWVSFSGLNAVGRGIPLRPGGPPLVLEGPWTAAALTEPIYAISEGVSENIGVVDFFD